MQELLLLLLLEITLKSQPAEIYIDVNYLTLKTTGVQCAIWGGGLLLLNWNLSSIPQESICRCCGNSH